MRIHSTPSLHTDNLHGYIQRMCKQAFISNDEAYELATAWKEKQDKDALDKLVKSHMRMILKMSRGYVGYGVPLEDLISESTIGILHAVKHYDHTKGMKFSNYAAVWIKAMLHRFVFRYSHIVRLGNGSKNVKMFFNVRKMKTMLNMQDEEIAEELGVSVQETQDVLSRLLSQDFSLNQRMSVDGHEFIDSIKDESCDIEENVLHSEEYRKRSELLRTALCVLSEKERSVFVKYRLSDKHVSFQKIASELNMTSEGVRLIDRRAFQKVSSYVIRHSKKLSAFVDMRIVVSVSLLCLSLLLVWTL